jgi:hypothetical protein
MRWCDVRGRAVRLTGLHLGGVRVARVCVTSVSMAGATVPMSGVPMSGVPMSGVSDVRDAADRHRGEASSAQREGEPIDVHTTEYYAPNDRLVTGVLPG